jgi:hypothetical protein
LQGEIHDVRYEFNRTPHHHAKPQQERYVHGNTTDNRMLLGDCLQEQEKLQRDNERLTKENKKLMDENRKIKEQKNHDRGRRSGSHEGGNKEPGSYSIYQLVDWFLAAT